MSEPHPSWHGRHCSWVVCYTLVAIVSRLCVLCEVCACAAGEATFYNLDTLYFCELSARAEEIAEH